jgi:hypothetical protein
MSEWKRSTRELSFDQLPAEMQTEINRHIELYNLGDILSDALICIHSSATKAKAGLFGAAETNQMGVVLTPRWLVWVITGTKTPASALSALLQDIVVQDYAETPFAKMVPDSGVQVSGKFTDVSESASAFIGLEENEAGSKFKELLVNAAQDAKK